MNKKNIVSVLVLIIVGIVCFYSGMTYGGNNVRASINARGQNFNNRGNRNNSGFISGSIISKDDKSVTVNIPTGGSKIIFLDNNTKILKSTNGNLADLNSGTQISVNGTLNSDGSVIAQTIQIRPSISFSVVK